MPSILSNVKDRFSNIRSPFSGLSKSPPLNLRGQDYKDGFRIEEHEYNEEKKEFVASNAGGIALKGNQMPKIPFEFGGEQRISKTYYPGNDEPVMQVMGASENDVTIRGLFIDIKFNDSAYSEDEQSFAEFTMERIEGIRQRGKLCRIALGDWQRYVYVQSTKFSLINRSRISYSITFRVVSINLPQNAKVLRVGVKENPKALNEKLLALGEDVNKLGLNKPPVDLSISEQIDAFVGDIADSIKNITDYVDSVFTTIEDIRRSVRRAVGMVKFTQRKLKSFQNKLRGFNPFDLHLNTSLSDRYIQAAYYSSLISRVTILNMMMERYRKQFKDLSQYLPLARYLVKIGDTWQSVSVRFYGTSTDWTDIPPYNNFEISASPPVGRLIEIPDLLALRSARE